MITLHNVSKPYINQSIRNIFEIMFCKIPGQSHINMQVIKQFLSFMLKNDAC